MKVSKLLMLPILISGVIFVALVRSASLQGENSMIYAIASLFLFIVFIVIYDKVLTRPSEKKKVSEQNIPRGNAKMLHKLPKVDYKYYTTALIGAVLVGTYGGYKLKKPGSQILYRAQRKDTKWKRDDYINSRDGGLFDLSGFEYNWEFLFITILVVMGLAYFIRQTVYYDKINAYFNSIRRKD